MTRPDGEFMTETEIMEALIEEAEPVASFQMPIEKPEEIKARLRSEGHWKEGRSAYELATGWMNARGIPERVREVLDQAAEWRDAQLLDAIFERKTKMPGAGYSSQTDLLAIVRLADGNGIIAVEGKVDEKFGDLISDWLQGDPPPAVGQSDQDRAKGDRSRKNRRRRLGQLCGVLEVDSASVGHLHYQLFHRTCAALFEAQRFRYARAIMMVHSFDASISSLPANFESFTAFSKAISLPMLKADSLSNPKQFGEIEFRLGWVSDRPHGHA